MNFNKIHGKQEAITHKIQTQSTFCFVMCVYTIQTSNPIYAISQKIKACMYYFWTLNP